MRGTKYLSEILPIDKVIESNKGAFIISPSLENGIPLIT